ncbi:MAG: metalloregulator ArsR/SmtB family transcription factor [Gammaproteobacteria bacterium]|jgi:DNA-binding transcriptional ArsR family regulator|nr:metalloregulator ArsR/SmtB family transcription factor [Gammaproteobacteria bacterium]MBU0771369.1 metalloregulator ArsR/SmtB family transcription factor [Gammaproteobacteria bacterium]MBU0857115.1 metalloregulator ArsR/SmtB family transcription factor [Gammaproteobacteria bacterium]MBU1847993.1 metalloregulator ArsR/SmtB family transcription factor [Gammaproteobacteria bacterium]
MNIATREFTDLRAAAQRACTLLKAMAHEDRLVLLCQLSQGEHTVGELEARLGIVQPTLSQQLGVLRREGLVITRRDGKHIHYRIASDDALAIMQTLYQRFCGEGNGEPE